MIEQATTWQVTQKMIDAGVRVLYDSGRLTHEAEGADDELVAALLFAALSNAEWLN